MLDKIKNKNSLKTEGAFRNFFPDKLVYWQVPESIFVYSGGKNKYLASKNLLLL